MKVYKDPCAHVVHTVTLIEVVPMQALCEQNILCMLLGHADPSFMTHPEGPSTPIVGFKLGPRIQALNGFWTLRP